MTTQIARRLEALEAQSGKGDDAPAEGFPGVTVGQLKRLVQQIAAEGSRLRMVSHREIQERAAKEARHV